MFIVPFGICEAEPNGEPFPWALWLDPHVGKVWGERCVHSYVRDSHRLGVSSA